MMSAQSVPDNIEDYRDISKSIEMLEASNRSVSLRGTLIFFALGFFAASYTR
jgi:hypothetical protein